MIRWLFTYQVSPAQAGIAAAVTYGLMRGHYWLALALFVFGAAVCVAVELYLERGQ